MARFGKIVKLTAFRPFTSASDSLEQINAVSEGQLTDELKHFLEQNLPKVSRQPNTAPTPLCGCQGRCSSGNAGHDSRLLRDVKCIREHALCSALYALFTYMHKHGWAADGL